MEPPTQTSVAQQPQQAPTQPVGSFTVPPPKRQLPKILIWVGVGILALIIIFSLVKILTSKGKVGGTAQITWWGLWEDQTAVDSLITEYETAHPKVKINYLRQSQADYRERLTSSLAKGQGPDIFRFHNTWVPMFKTQLDTLPASVMNPADYSKTFYPIAASDLTLGNGIVGIPLEYDAILLYINSDIFDKAGKTPPTTWAELRSLAKELTVKDDQGVITQSGVALGRTENVDHWPEILGLMMLQNGVDPVHPDKCSAAPPGGTGGSTEVCPGADALTFFSLFSTVDGVWDATLPPSTAAFAAGKLAMYFAPSWRAFEIQQANPNLKFKTVGVPQLPKDSPNQPDIAYATYWAEGVWSRSSSKAAAWDFLKFLSTKDSMQKLYQNEARVRMFGEPYSRIDMASLLGDHPVIGSLINQAPGAESWYLASRTFDGPTGINSLLSKYFEDAINAAIAGQDIKKTLQTAAQGVSQVLSQYGLISK